MVDTSSAVKALTDVAIIGLTAGVTMKILDNTMKTKKGGSMFSAKPIDMKKLYKL
jgi:hypothetical protein